MTEASDFTPPFDLGLFGPRSMVWRVHGSPLGLIGGLRALMIQATEPRSLAGVVQFSNYRTDPLGRLLRTSEFVGITSFGERDEALAAVAQVKKIHERIHGVDPVSGLAFSANDPELSAFVHNALVESMATCVRRFQGGFSEGDLNRYVTEMRTLGQLMGATDRELPSTYQELRRWVERYPTLVVTEYTRAAVGDLFSLPVDFVAKPLYELGLRAAGASLPGWIRSELNLEGDALADSIVPLATRGVALMAGLALPSPPRIIIAKERMHANWRYELSHKRAIA